MKLRQRVRDELSLTARLAQRFVKPGHRAQCVGIAWYQQAQWNRLRQLDSNPEALEERYEDWLASANRTVATLRGEGLIVEQIPIDVEVAAKWATKRGLRFNGESRSSYVLDLLQQRGRRQIKDKARSVELKAESKPSKQRVVEQVDAADESHAKPTRGRGPRS